MQIDVQEDVDPAVQRFMMYMSDMQQADVHGLRIDVHDFRRLLNELLGEGEIPMCILFNRSLSPDRFVYGIADDPWTVFNAVLSVLPQHVSEMFEFTVSRMLDCKRMPINVQTFEAKTCEGCGHYRDAVAVERVTVLQGFRDVASRAAVTSLDTLLGLNARVHGRCEPCGGDVFHVSRKTVVVDPPNPNAQPPVQGTRYVVCP